MQNIKMKWNSFHIKWKIVQHIWNSQSKSFICICIFCFVRFLLAGEYFPRAALNYHQWHCCRWSFCALFSLSSQWHFCSCEFDCMRQTTRFQGFQVITFLLCMCSRAVRVLVCLCSLTFFYFFIHPMNWVHICICIDITFWIFNLRQNIKRRNSVYNLYVVNSQFALSRAQMELFIWFRSDICSFITFLISSFRVRRLFSAHRNAHTKRRNVKTRAKNISFILIQLQKFTSVSLVAANVFSFDEEWKKKSKLTFYERNMQYFLPILLVHHRIRTNERILAERKKIYKNVKKENWNALEQLHRNLEYFCCMSFSFRMGIYCFSIAKNVFHRNIHTIFRSYAHLLSTWFVQFYLKSRTRSYDANAMKFHFVLPIKNV